MDKKGAKSTGQWILGILFILYLMMDYRTPEPVGSLVNTLPGKIVVISVFLSLFFFSHPLLGILGLFVGFELIRRSGSGTYNSIFSSSGLSGLGLGGGGGFNNESSTILGATPAEKAHNSFYSATNQFPYTLEEEVVKNMTPSRNSSLVLKPAEYKPLMENVYDASSIK